MRRSSPSKLLWTVSKKLVKSSAPYVVSIAVAGLITGILVFLVSTTTEDASCMNSSEYNTWVSDKEVPNCEYVYVDVTVTPDEIKIYENRDEDEAIIQREEKMAVIVENAYLDQPEQDIERIPEKQAKAVKSSKRLEKKAQEFEILIQTQDTVDAIKHIEKKIAP